MFVSHATGDNWIATTLCALFEATGASTFRDDREIDGGDDIPDRIREEIKRSKEMVVLLSPYSVNRPWVLFETGAAWGQRRTFRITAVMCHVTADSIPELIKSKKAIDLNHVQDFLSELSLRVRTFHEKN